VLYPPRDRRYRVRSPRARSLASAGLFGLGRILGRADRDVPIDLSVCFLLAKSPRQNAQPAAVLRAMTRTPLVSLSSRWTSAGRTSSQTQALPIPVEMTIRSVSAASPLRRDPRLLEPLTSSFAMRTGPHIASSPRGLSRACRGPSDLRCRHLLHTGCGIAWPGSHDHRSGRSCRRRIRPYSAPFESPLVRVRIVTH